MATGQIKGKDTEDLVDEFARGKKSSVTKEKTAFGKAQRQLTYS